MSSTESTKRLFGDRFDRAAFSVYFLGAVVPLIGLAIVVERFALPSLDERSTEISLVVAVAFVTLLSFGAFLTFRSMTRGALRRMDRDNERLALLLRGSSSLSAVEHLNAALESAAASAVELIEAQASLVFLQSKDGDGPALCAQAGDGAQALYAKHARWIDPMVGSCTESGRAGIRGTDAGGLAAVAVPLTPDKETPGALVVLRTEGSGFEPEDADALSTLGGLASVAIHNADLRDSQRNFFSHVTDILVTALDSHLGFNQGHGRRVAQLANRFGRSLQLDDGVMERLHFAALLHDIGMLKLDRNQAMTPASCDKHCVLGHKMLSRIRLWREIAPIVYHHHEHFDGAGYPEGRSGQDIPLESRIISICDAVDSMTADSSYRPARSLEEAMQELQECAGTQFDPELVAAFVSLARENPEALETVG